LGECVDFFSVILPKKFLRFLGIRSDIGIIKRALHITHRGLGSQISKNLKAVFKFFVTTQKSQRFVLGIMEVNSQTK
jgi:hypothetical protein